MRHSFLSDFFNVVLSFDLSDEREEDTKIKHLYSFNARPFLQGSFFPANQLPSTLCNSPDLLPWKAPSIFLQSQSLSSDTYRTKIETMTRSIGCYTLWKKMAPYLFLNLEAKDLVPDTYP